MLKRDAGISSSSFYLFICSLMLAAPSWKKKSLPLNSVNENKNPNPSSKITVPCLLLENGEIRFGGFLNFFSFYLFWLFWDRRAAKDEMKQHLEFLALYNNSFFGQKASPPVPPSHLGYTAVSCKYLFSSSVPFFKKGHALTPSHQLLHLAVAAGSSCVELRWKLYLFFISWIEFAKGLRMP